MRGHLTYAEYLELEQRTGMRHEYLDGEAWMMAGGTMRHSAVKVNLVGALFTRLRGRPFRIYDSDLKTIVPPTGLATYADVAVICGPSQREHGAGQTFSLPAVEVELPVDELYLDLPDEAEAVPAGPAQSSG